MREENMFNLEQAIANWRRTMLAAGIKSPAPMDELELHLREEIERLMKAGMSGQAAFNSAVQSMGQPATLQHEFAKTGASKWTRLQRLKGALLRFIGIPHPATALADSAQDILEMSGKEALGFHHDFIGTEHVLLALLNVKSGTVSGVLQSLGVDHKTVRDKIEKIVAGWPQPVGHALSYTSRVKKALQLAGAEARAMNQTRVGPEHIFLGLLQEGGGVAALVLKTLGVSSRDAREEIVENLDRNQPGA
jgi:hypothetical protein